MNAQELKDFLIRPDMREALNWKGLERITGINPLRIKSVCIGRGGGFRADEVEKLNSFFLKFHQAFLTADERAEYNKSNY